MEGCYVTAFKSNMESQHSDRHNVQYTKARDGEFPHTAPMSATFTTTKKPDGTLDEMRADYKPTIPLTTAKSLLGG